MALKLYLQRHCEPRPGHPMDGTRPLLADGKTQAGQMAGWLKEQIGRVDIVITSPFLRAMQTAEIMAEALGAHVADTRMLEPDGTPEEAWKEIERLAQQSEHVLVVGHEPMLNLLLAWLMSGGDVRFQWGAIAHLKVKTSDDSEPRVHGRLHWFVDSKVVEIDEDEEEILEAARELVRVL
jgi:phosphohistidine phosphatase